MKDRTSWATLGSAFSIVMMVGAQQDVTAQSQATDIDLYLNGLNAHKGIKVAPADVSVADKARIDAFRTEYPNMKFVKLGHLAKHVTLNADNVTFNPANRTLTVSALNLKHYRDTLTFIYLTPFTAWPSHTVVAFNGMKPGKEDICAFMPNSDVAEARSIRVLRGAIEPDFRINWDRARQTPPAGNKEDDLATQQTIRLSNTRLPTHLFDARKLTCVAVEMPDTDAMKRLADAPDGVWVTVVKDGQLVRDPVPKAGTDSSPPPQPTQ